MSRSTAAYLVSIDGLSGLEITACLVLDEKPIGQERRLKTLSKYVREHPRGWKKRKELADLLSAMGRWEEAVGEYRQVLSRQPRLIEVRLQLGKILQMMARKAEAIEAYKGAMALTGNPATRQHLSGLIESCRQGDRFAAIAFESAAALEADNPAHWLALGQTQLRIGNPAAALRAFDAILGLNPEETTALIYSYDALFTLSRFREAHERVNRALELAPEDFRALKRVADYRCGMRLVSRAEGKQTKQYIRRALRQVPNASGASESLAYYHVFRGQWKKGVAVLQQFVVARPNNPGGWYSLARCLFHVGENQKAAEAILRAQNLYPEDCEIYRLACDILPEAGKLQELQPLVQEMLGRFPQRWSIRAAAGRVLVEDYKDIERGLAVAATATELQPQVADAWFWYGRVLALGNQHQKAVAALERGWQCWQSDGGCPLPAALWLGESYRALGNQAKSRQWWQEAARQAGELMVFNPAVASYWQGKALKGLGDKKGAERCFGLALDRQLLYPARGEIEKT